MKAIWYIAKKDLLQAVRDRASLFLLLVMPLLIIAIVGFALGSLYSNASTIDITVAVSNQDTGNLGQTITKALDVHSSSLAITTTKYATDNEVQQAVKNNTSITTGIVIPQNATTTIQNTLQNNTIPSNIIKVYTVPQNNDPRATIIQNIISSAITADASGTKAVQEVFAVCHATGNRCIPGTIQPSQIGASVGAVSVQTGNKAIASINTGAAKNNSFDQTVPGYAVFFALFGINAVAGTILQEKEDGTFRRLLIAPINKYALLGGKMLAQFILTFMQLIILFVIGYFVFHLDIGSWPAVIAVLLTVSFATTGLGILLVSIVKTRRQFNPLVTLVVLTTSAIGGAWWPLYIEPVFMQQIAKVGVTAWAMEALNGIMLYGKGLSATIPDILGLLAYGLICFFIATRIFKFQQQATA
jgi:ABC-2 type transport system permease protein